MAKTKREEVCAMHLWRQIRENPYFQNPDTFARLVFLIENRPGGPHIYDRQIRRGLQKRHLSRKQLKSLIDRIGGKAVLIEIIAEFVGGVATLNGGTTLTNRELMETVLREGLCRDTNKIRRWIAHENEKLDLHNHPDLRPLELVVVHAHTQISELYDLTVRRGLRPAAFMSSGSGEMVDKVKGKEWLQEETEIIGWSREKEIPFFGICFGQQVLGYQAFGVMPVYHRVPDGVTHERRSGKSLPVTPGTKRMVYGSRTIMPFNQTLHPVMKGVNQVECLEAHAMGFELGGLTPTIPLDKIQAVSADRFYHQDSPTSEVTRVTVEVIADGYAVGAQLHPEVTAQFLILLLELVPNLANGLKAEGHDLECLRDELRRYRPDKYSAGERLGFNFFKYVMTPNLIDWLRDSKRISADTASQLLKLRFHAE